VFVLSFIIHHLPKGGKAMAEDVSRLSVVCPAYQEEEVLPHFHRELSAVLDCLGEHYEVEVIYVDDGSRDRSLKVIKELAQRDARIRYLSLSRNFGHQAALTAGLEHARGDVVITLDSDLQHPPALLPVLLERWRKGFDIVLTIRQDDPRLGIFKRWTSRWFYRVMGLLSDTDIRLAAADYRLMSRQAVDALLQLRETHRFLRGMVQWLGFRVAEVPFQPATRQAGVSKYTFRRMVNFAVDGIFSFSKVPLRLAVVFGFLAVFLSLLFAGGTAVRWCLTGFSGAMGWAAVLISLHFLGGCILLALGIVGEYVGRIYDQVKGRPLYLLKDKSPEPRGLPWSGVDRDPPRPYGQGAEEGRSAA
jgi:dolichol-phosphate mannosyltransferase